jgi:hypothetical protein
MKSRNIQVYQKNARITNTYSSGTKTDDDVGACSVTVPLTHVAGIPVVVNGQQL